MPFIVTIWPPCAGCVDPSAGPHIAQPSSSRRAVATLEEAQRATCDAVRAAFAEVFEAFGEGYGFASADDAAEAAQAMEHEALSLPESGGTIGPLPDGTLIEVERVTFGRLCRMMPPEVVSENALAWSKSSDQILDAFNAREQAR